MKPEELIDEVIAIATDAVALFVRFTSRVILSEKPSLIIPLSPRRT